MNRILVDIAAVWHWQFGFDSEVSLLTAAVWHWQFELDSGKTFYFDNPCFTHACLHVMSILCPAPSFREKQNYVNFCSGERDSHNVLVHTREHS